MTIDHDTLRDMFREVLASAIAAGNAAYLRYKKVTSQR